MSTMAYSRIDQFYRSLLLTKFFTKGWGKPDNLKRIFEFRKILSNRESCQALVEKDYPILIDKEYKDGDCRILEGHFKSPFVNHMPGIMPKEVETASFQVILPHQWQYPKLKPICIHLAGTGDHFFWRRRVFTARPLLKEFGIASILLENPFYGSRKPKSQVRSSLHNVSDLFVMGGALVLECLALLHWCERQNWGPFGLSGVSMGGHMASLAATNWEKPISLIPCLSWSTASCVFTQGVMSGAIPWHVLQEQFFKNNLYNDEISKLIVSPEKAYKLGQDFVINYAKEMEKTKGDEKMQPTSGSNLRAVSSPAAFTDTNTDTSILKPESSRVTDENYSNHKNNILNSAYSMVKSEPEVLLAGSSVSSASSSSLPLNEKDVKLNSIAATTSGGDDDYSPQRTQSVSSSANHSDSKGTTPKPKSSKEELRHLSLNYAKTKTLQQSMDSRSRENKQALTLGHAVAKSKILFSRKKEKKIEDYKRMKTLQDESYEFMRGVMDECTHLGNFSVPVDPELVIIVSAIQDAYIPRDGVVPLDKLWPGSEVRFIDQGHIGAVLLHQKVFRKALKDAFDKQIQKYYPGESLEWRTRGKSPRRQSHS